MDYDLYRDIDDGPRPIRVRAGQRQTRTARIAQGATSLGISVEMYEMHVEAGERWCSGHQRWCMAADFRPSTGSCREGHALYHRTYQAAKKARGA